jgi:hypothetical protein
VSLPRVHLLQCHYDLVGRRTPPAIALQLGFADIEQILRAALIARWGEDWEQKQQEISVLEKEGVLTLAEASPEHWSKARKQLRTQSMTAGIANQYFGGENWTLFTPRAYV